MNTAESTRRYLFRSIGVVEAAALIVGLLYFTGYYINSVFMRNYGIPESELFRLEYVKIGFVFWLITSGIVLLPFGSFFLTHKVRGSSGLPHFTVGWIGNSLNAIVMLGVPLALSFFATQYEWYFSLPHPILGFRIFNVAVAWGLSISSFGIICIPFIERLVFWFTEGRVRTWLFRLVIEPVRFGCLVLSLYLILGAAAQIPWLPIVFGRAGGYIAVSALFVGGMTAATYWIRHIQKIRGSAMVFVLIGFGVCFFFYLSIASYVFGVYPAIPANRGGMMPVTEAYVEASGHDSLFQREVSFQGLTLRGPIYILEQTSDRIYFASEDMDKWFQRFVPVHALGTSSLPYIRFERINDGFPRVPRSPQSP
jgi:hypothetical protein